MFNLIFSIVSIILSIVITRYYSMRKILILVVVSIVDIIDLRRIEKEKIKILYQGKSIDYLWAIRVIVQNDGNSDISKKVIRVAPRIELSECFKIIDVESSYIDSNCTVKAFIEDERSAVLEIEYLQRRKCAAFQLLVHSPKEIELSSKDIEFNKGVIENTEIKTINLLRNGVPVAMDALSDFLSRFKGIIIWIIIWLYIIAGDILILFGLFLIVRAFFANPPKSDAFMDKILFLGVSIIIFGLILMVPMLHIRKARRYSKMFRKVSEK